MSGSSTQSPSALSDSSNLRELEKLLDDWDEDTDVLTPVPSTTKTISPSVFVKNKGVQKWIAVAIAIGTGIGAALRALGVLK
jgi:hypothetical protein